MKGKWFEGYGMMYPEEEIQPLMRKIDELENWIKSDSVYTLLRYGSKSPSSSGVDDCE